MKLPARVGDGAVFACPRCGAQLAHDSPLQYARCTVRLAGEVVKE